MNRIGYDIYSLGYRQDLWAPYVCASPLNTTYGGRPPLESHSGAAL